MKLRWIILAVVLLAAWYLLSPAFKVTELQETSPLEIKDAMETMDAATKEKFEDEVEAVKDVVMTMNDVMPKASIVSQGNFQARAHDVTGKALLIQTGNEYVLRFEDFETINGPDLHIYLSSELGDDDFVDLGKIKATKGNVNYEIPPGTDLKKFDNVLVWCVPFKVLFSYAVLE